MRAIAVDADLDQWSNVLRDAVAHASERDISIIELSDAAKTPTRLEDYDFVSALIPANRIADVGELASYVDRWIIVLSPSNPVCVIKDALRQADDVILGDDLDTATDIVLGSVSGSPSRRPTYRLLSQLFTGRAHRSDPVSRINRLTAREKEVASRIADGLTNREIAAELSVSSVTVNAYVRQIFSKTGARNRVALARLWDQASQVSGADSDH